MKTNQNTEQSTANVKFYLDSNGNGWYCSADVSKSDDYRNENCVSDEEWIYDRSFGG